MSWACNVYGADYLHVPGAQVSSPATVARSKRFVQSGRLTTGITEAPFPKLTLMVDGM